MRCSVLTVADPNVPTNLVAYHFKDREYKTIPPGPLDNIVFHFCMDGSALHTVGFTAVVCLYVCVCVCACFRCSHVVAAASGVSGAAG